jgi:hypothetical protein
VITKQEELDQINLAISAIYAGGQSYTINSGGASRQVTRANLKELLARKEELEDDIAAQTSGGAGIRITPAW